MQAIKHSLKQFLERRALPVDLGAKLEQLFSHPSVESWLEKHPDWTKEDLLPFLAKVKQYIQEKENCGSCTGLTSCSNLMQGHLSTLINYGNMLELSYSPCSYFKQAEEEKKRRHLIRSHHIPKEITEGSFHQFDKEESGRIDAFNAVLEFCLTVQPGKSAVGLYLYGHVRSGQKLFIGSSLQ